MSDNCFLVYQVLEQRCSFEVVKKTRRSNSLRVLGRLPKKQISQFESLIHHTLCVAMNQIWNIDVSRMYLIIDGELRYAWRLIFEVPSGVELVEHLPVIAKTMSESPRAASVEVNSIRLVGARPGNERGKGAAPFGRAIVGEARKRALFG